MLTGLLGRHNVAAPTLAGLATNFGLSPLIDKPLALISDARLSGRTDSSVVVERLLSISGEDAITVDRKYREPWTGRLPARFVILTNELPRLSDSSGALASRFVALVLTRSFYGHENPLLTDELLAEAPGIFNWALDGLDRLTERGYFVVPTSARESIDALADLASPAAAPLSIAVHRGPAVSFRPRASRAALSVHRGRPWTPRSRSVQEREHVDPHPLRPMPPTRQRPTHRRRQPLPPMPRPATPTPHPPTTSKEDHVTQHRVRTSSTADGYDIRPPGERSEVSAGRMRSRNYLADVAWRVRERWLGRFGLKISGGGLSSSRTSCRASHTSPAM